MNFINVYIDNYYNYLLCNDLKAELEWIATLSVLCNNAVSQSIALKWSLCYDYSYCYKDCCWIFQTDKVICEVSNCGYEMKGYIFA